MFKSIEEIKKDVRIRLDMNQEDESLVDFGDIDTLSLDEIIEAKILEGVRIIEMNAPLSMFDVKKSMPNSLLYQVSWESGRTKNVAGKKLLPMDFMRLMSFKMSDWDYAVTEAIDENSDEYKVQKSRFGVRGNAQRPVVAIVQGAAGLMLEFYSCKDNSATVSHALYIAEPKFEENEIGEGEDEETIKGVNMQTRLYDSCVYEIARLVLVTLGEGEKAGAMDAVADEFVAGDDSEIQTQG